MILITRISLVQRGCTGIEVMIFSCPDVHLIWINDLSLTVQIYSNVNLFLPVLPVVICLYIRLLCAKQEAQLMLTNPRDALRGQSRWPNIVVPYIFHMLVIFLLCNSNFVFKTRRFSDIRLQTYRDLEIEVRGHSRSLKVVPFGRSCMVSY